MRQLITVLCLYVFGTSVMANEQLFTSQPSLMPQLANTGEYAVGVTMLSPINKGQLSASDFTSLVDRKLPLAIWYPTADKQTSNAIYSNVTRSHQAFSIAGEAIRDAKPLSHTTKTFPLVVISHGYPGYNTLMFYLGEHLASHGYVVAAIDHTDSTNAELDIVNAPNAGFVSTLLNRSRDQQFVLEYFSELTSPLGNITDSNNSSVIGYSMGGYGAINTIGGCYASNVGMLERLGFPKTAASALVPLFNFCNAGLATVDPRWKAMVAYAPWGQEHDMHQAQALANIKVPSLYVAGEQDDISGYSHGVKKLYEQTGDKETYLLTYENARHNFAPHPAPKIAYQSEIDLGHYVEPSWHKESLTRLNEHFTLAFLNCKVKQKTDACNMLPTRQSITQKKQKDGQLTPPWLGFPDRWGTGVRFERKDK